MNRTLALQSRIPQSPLRRSALIQLLLIGAGTAMAQSPAQRVIDIEARRFRYTPNIISLKRGETVTLAFHAIDFIHGFHAPDFHLRADLLPGQITSIELQPMSAGRFPFLCDNFCGDDHESMSAMFIVEA